MKRRTQNTYILASVCFGLLCFGFIMSGVALAQEAAQLPAPITVDDGSDDTDSTDSAPSGVAAPGAPDVATADYLTEEDILRQQQAEREFIEQESRRLAFDGAINSLMPLKPEEIREVLRIYHTNQEAVEKPVFPYPEAQVKVIDVALDPGVAPPVIKMATGHVTTLNILDITGRPWPVQDVSWAGDFDVITPEEGGHVIRITPMAAHGYGNMSIRMLDLTTPITFTLRTQRNVAQYRLDARIGEYGPQADIPLIDNGISTMAGDSVLTSILDGVPPGGVEKFKVTGVDGRTTVYGMNGQTYVRTPLTLLSPGWSASVSSADGMKVYNLGSAPVLLLSDNGRMKRAYVSKEDESDDE